MGLFLNKQKVFISHKRIDGTASPEAILLKQMLDENVYLDNFIDVHEDTLGDFPEFLSLKINASDSFVFLIPSDGNISFLYNEEGWVYKEIKIATLKYLMSLGNTKKTSFQILPITFSESFNWPDNLPNSISTIGSFDICRLSLNEKPDNIQTELAKALNIQPRSRINWLRCAFIFVLVLFAIFWSAGFVKQTAEDKLNERRITFIKNSIDGKIANRIRPFLIIPSEDRTPFDDSIYHFFELRDRYYNTLKTLQSIDDKIVNWNDFSKENVMKILTDQMGCLDSIQIVKKQMPSDVYFPTAIDTTVLGGLLLYHLTINAGNDIINQSSLLLDMYRNHNKKLERVVDRSSSVLHDAKAYYNAGDLRNTIKIVAKYTENFDYWDLINQSTILFEEMAKLGNIYLTVPWRDSMYKKYIYR